ncbi:MAG: TrmH family RNA methyltransferase [Candidatus Acidiferrales bacterium]
MDGTANAEKITSRENKWLKTFRAALRGNGPHAGEPIGVEGRKFVEEALRSGLRAEALLLTEETEPQAAEILVLAGKSSADIARQRVLKTSAKLFGGVAGTDSPQGVAAIFHQPVWSFEDVLRGTGEMHGAAPLVVVLAGVQDPGNVGTAVRSAEAFGATGVICTRGTADPWSPKALRASAGSALRLPLLRGMAAPVVLAQLRMARVRIIAASSRGASQMARAEDLRGDAAIFIGNEGAGLAEEIIHAADAAISIPMSEAVESLNAGVAASVVLYEAARQRGAPADRKS